MPQVDVLVFTNGNILEGSMHEPSEIGSLTPRPELGGKPSPPRTLEDG